MNAPTPANEARIASTTVEIADDVAPLLLLLLLPVDGVGELVEEELLGGSEAVDGPLAVDEEEPMKVAVGPPWLEFVRDGGMEVFPLRLHLGLPAESRKHVYAGGQQKFSPVHTT